MFTMQKEESTVEAVEKQPWSQSCNPQKGKDLWLSVEMASLSWLSREYNEN